jgi:hypothetical protein
MQTQRWVLMAAALALSRVSVPAIRRDLGALETDRGMDDRAISKEKWQSVSTYLRSLR